MAKLAKNKDVEKIRMAIRTKGLRQDILARKLNYTPVYLSYILNYKYILTDKFKKALFQELGIKDKQPKKIN